MKHKQHSFLSDLLSLCKGYGDVEFTYTTDDDGIHIILDGEDIFKSHSLLPDIKKKIKEDG